MFLAVVSDLVFRSRIREALGKRARFLSRVEEVKSVELSDCTHVLLDLNNTRVSFEEVIFALKERSFCGEIICYCSHIDTELMARAKEVGATQVMPRSRFVEFLQEQRMNEPIEREQTSTIKNQTGASHLTAIVFGAIFCAALYYCFKVFPFYYYYYELVNQMEASVKGADILTDQEIRKNLMRSMKELKIPADPEQLKIERRDRFIRIQLVYREVFYIKFRDKYYDLQFFDFDARAEGKF